MVERQLPFIDLAAQYRRIAADVRARIDRVLAHGQFILGPEVAELEQQLATYAGTRHAIAVASGTDALVMALMALGIGPGDEVITTPFTFIATAEAVRLAGATPRFADIEPDTWNLDPQSVAERLRPRTRAIIAVDLFGQCADYARLEALAARRGVALIEDAAQSFGATQHGRRACSFGRVACTSFFPTKPLGAYGDGGACFTDDDALAQALREIRVHGQSTYGECARVGLNGRLDTLQAAVLLAKLAVFDAELAQRRAAAARYARLLDGRVGMPQVRPGNASAWAQYTVDCERRDALRSVLAAAGIPARVYYPAPLHRQAPYADGSACPVAERAAQRVLSLPLHADLDAATQERIAAAVQRAA